jgi:hypothetical protein
VPDVRHGVDPAEEEPAAALPEPEVQIAALGRGKVPECRAAAPAFFAAAFPDSRGRWRFTAYFLSDIGIGRSQASRSRIHPPSTPGSGGMNFFLVRLIVWFVALVVFPIPVTLLPRSFQIEVLQCISLDALPQERPLDLDRTERVLAYLETAGKNEIDAWLRDDIRIAWITAKWSQHGVPEWSWRKDSPPHVAATYQVLNCLPDEVWPRILAKRKEKLGSEYSRFYDANDQPIFISSVKKPCASERWLTRRKKAASEDLAA